MRKSKAVQHSVLRNSTNGSVSKIECGSIIVSGNLDAPQDIVRFECATNANVRLDCLPILSILREVNWYNFELHAPALAKAGKDRFERSHFALIGTSGHDNWPRISPTEPLFIGNDLVLGMIW